MWAGPPSPALIVHIRLRALVRDKLLSTFQPHNLTPTGRMCQDSSCSNRYLQRKWSRQVKASNQEHAKPLKS